MNRQRIWELDALRGVCILCVIVVHTLFDLVYFAGVQLRLPAWYRFIQQYGGILFILLSGCCATLGRRRFRRGLIVFGCGMLITAVTWAMYRLGFAGRDVVVMFGVLHLIGVCMMLYPLFSRLPTAALAPMALAMVLAGYLMEHTTVQTHVLFPLGLVYPGFASGDYFPLLPHLGWYLLGVCIGRTLYREKRSLLPQRTGELLPMRVFRWCGRQSLLIYLLHQPLVYGLMELVLLLRHAD